MSTYVHAWGHSHAADQVWCHVNGLPPDRAGGRLLMVWQAYIDESIDEDYFVIGGYVASAESWAKFSVDWSEMLPQSCMGSDGQYRFKMSEMALNSERMARVPGFFRIIERHLPAGLHCNLRVSDFRNAKKRIVAIHRSGKRINFQGKLFDNIYFFALTRLMTMFHAALSDAIVQNVIPPNNRVDFIFDDRAEKKILLEAYDRMVAISPHSNRYGRTPRFEDDAEFMPLQAADFLVWWVREWRSAPAKYANAAFPWKEKGNLLWIRGDMTEDDIVADMIEILRYELKGQAEIFAIA